ncbi:hypothetical protein KPG66_05730 [Mycetohabitans sp. B2]|uniref:hypothetical protein n=1 Tax=Mycetohabitans sp. B2 TaxID=2841274 RepID=UPI001F483238|nr:hypothetical protein [Mycetohabitans sp. B2]MCF7695631.1 hypothetical protein [Mycetohabitans sp. B2]
MAVPSTEPAADIQLKLRLQTAEQALADAYRRMQQLEQDNQALQQQLGQTEGMAQAAQHALDAHVAPLRATIDAGQHAAQALTPAGRH